MDAEILKLLRALLQQTQAGDQTRQLATIEQIGLSRLFELRTLLYALGVGGVGFTTFLAELATDNAAEPERYRKILAACQKATPGNPGDTALRIVEAFGIEGPADAFLRSIQQEFAILSGSPADLLQAALAELKAENWSTALAGFARVRAELGEKTPRIVQVHLATCLHKLGRYAEAEEMNLQGLGEQRELITPKAPLPSEADIVGRWKATTTPVVSILCTAYNHERYIDSAIRGFLIQETEFSYEILVHDDASTDGTAAKIRAWQEKYPSLIRAVLQTENQYSKGVRPFDLLLKQARGRYVALCEGDDYWIEPGKLQKQVGFLEQHPDFSCSAHNYYLYNESLLSVTRWNSTNVDRMLTPAQLMSITRLLWCPTVVFRKSFTSYPPERYQVALGDQFLTSFLGTFGACAYFESLVGSVRRENRYSIWTPVSAQKKDQARVRTWAALVAMHERLGNHAAAAALRKRIQGSPLGATEKSTLLETALQLQDALAPAI